MSPSSEPKKHTNLTTRGHGIKKKVHVVDFLLNCMEMLQDINKEDIEDGQGCICSYDTIAKHG